MIAGQAATWGSASTVEDKRAVSKNNGICEFRIDYTVHNLGNAPMMPTSSTFRTLFTNSAVSGNWAHVWALMPAKSAKSYSERIPLRPGSNLLRQQFLQGDSGR
jgi:hypothetical protein